MKKPIILICILLVFSLNLVAAKSQKEVQEKKILTIASDDWCPFICDRGGMQANGFLVDFVQEAMAFEGYVVKPVILPLNRAIIETIKGNVDGIYAPPIDQRLIYSNVIFNSRACFFSRITSKWQFNGLASLEKIKLGVVDDYGYDNGAMDKYLKDKQHLIKNSNITFSTGDGAGVKNLKMLLLGRFDAYLEHEAVLLQLSSVSNLRAKLRNAGCLKDLLPLVVGFSSQSPNSKKHIKALNQGIIKMLKSGKLQKLKDTYHITDKI